MGVYLTLVNGLLWTWIDGDLFIPESWLAPEAAAKRRKVGLPAECTFQTKPELGWAMIQRAWTQGIPLEPDPRLLDHYDTDVLPALSLANVRELLRVALPLPQLSSQQAAALVVQHLDNRLRSRRSRLRMYSGP